MLTSRILFCLNCSTLWHTMAPTMAKVRKTKGVASTAPQAKRTKMAGSEGLAHTVTVQGQYQINGDEVPVTIQDDHLYENCIRLFNNIVFSNYGNTLFPAKVVSMATKIM